MASTWFVVLTLSLVGSGGSAEKHDSAHTAGSKWKPAAFRTSYSPLHYWAPRLYRARAWLHDGREYIYPPGYQEKRFSLKKGEKAPTKQAPTTTNCPAAEVKPAAP